MNLDAIQMAGSNRSLLYLDGYDELAALIGDPECSYEDEYLAIPQGIRCRRRDS